MRVLNLCLEPISINSVLVVFRVSLSANCEHFLSLGLNITEDCLHNHPRM